MITIDDMPLDCWVKRSELIATQRYNRRFVSGSPLEEYLETQQYALDRAELASYEKCENPHPCTLDRIQEVKVRIARYEQNYERKTGRKFREDNVR